MNTKWLSLLLVLILALGGLTLARAAPESTPLSQAGGAPTVVSYQGRVQVSGAPFTGSGYFKFAVVNQAGNITYWSNDGTGSGGNEPTAAVPLTVNNGLFTVLLGDTTLSGMTQSLSAAVFAAPDRYLRVWFRPGGSGAFTLLTPDTRIAAVPYALQAQHAAPPGNVIVVAKSNGDFNSIQGAINSITDASAGNPYLIWVAPGWYNEAVKMNPYIHLQGAGQGVTVIQAAVPNGAVLKLVSNTSVRDLSVSNIGSGPTNYGISGQDVTGVEIANVFAEAGGLGTSNIAIYLTGDSEVVLENVTAEASKASNSNTGLSITLGPEVTLHGGAFTGMGGTYAYGIWVAGGSDTFLGAADVRAIGQDASDTNAGLENGNYPTVLLQGGFFLGSGGEYAYGIYNHNAALLEAEGVTAQGENAETARALYNYTDSRAILRGGSFTARTSVTAGMAYAIHNAGGANTILETHDVTALAEGTAYSQGLRNEAAGTVARVNGGTFTARGGSMTAIGISTWGNLTAQGTSALAENGTVGNYGLYVSGDQARADACRFKGSTYAVRETSGALYLAVSQLDGGMQRTAGTVTCFEVYNGNYAAYSCP
ncbi:MAG: hypothetical protein H5T61_03125 [Thermoflexales bacterium]|nr:hypothetical protein [Thermoflexales bacterium]